MTPSEKKIVKSLVAVAWADGKVEKVEEHVIEGLLAGFDATDDEEKEILEYAKEQRTLDKDMPLGDLDKEDRELLLANAALLTHADGEQSESEKALLDKLIHSSSSRAKKPRPSSIPCATELFSSVAARSKTWNRMLDRNERNYFTGQDVQGVVMTLQGALAAQGIYLQPYGPSNWSGRGQAASYGIAPKASLTATPVQGGFFVDLRFSPDFESNSLVLFIVAWLVFFPVAVILAVMAYQDWEVRQRQLFYAVWSPVAGLMAPPPMGMYGMPPGAGQPVPPPGFYR